MILQGANILREHKKKNLHFDGELKRITLPDRRVYQVGKKYYPSVTTILQYMPKGKFFEQWLKETGVVADVILRKAGEEGSQVHEAAEELIQGREVTWLNEYGNAKYSEKVWGMVCRFAECWKALDAEAIAIEEFLVSHKYEYAGTADLVVRIKDEIWLLDIKTSNYLHRSYSLQLSAYAKAWEEQFGQKIDRTGIIWLKSKKRGPSKVEGVYQGEKWELKPIDEIDFNFELFEAIHKFYKLDNPTEKLSLTTLPISLKL